MRQLDLFGSLFDTPPEENKPVEKQPAPKKEEESLTFAEAGAHSYSKNVLHNQTGDANRFTTGPGAEPPVKKQESPASGTLRPPLLLSLFDVPFVEQEIETVSHELEGNLSEKDLQTQIREQHTEQLNTTAVFATDIEYEAKVFNVEEQAEIALPSSPPEPAAEAKKKIATPKAKKFKAPELERNGPVIFDDGKITVKIKNRNPFPPPIVKEKKEKVKKPPQKRGRKSFKEIDAEVDLIEIPEDDILFQKQYYAISEVAKWFRVNTSLLRFWENEFDVLKPRKNRKGDRLFRPEDVKNLQLIYQLLRQRKYTIEGAKEYIKTNKKKADIQLQLTNTLQKFKSFLLDLKANLQP